MSFKEFRVHGEEVRVTPGAAASGAPASGTPSAIATAASICRRGEGVTAIYIYIYIYIYIRPTPRKLAQTTPSAIATAASICSRGQDGRCKATWKREYKLPWREAGPPNHHDDNVDSDQ